MCDRLQKYKKTIHNKKNIQKQRLKKFKTFIFGVCILGLKERIQFGEFQVDDNWLFKLTYC